MVIGGTVGVHCHPSLNRGNGKGGIPILGHGGEQSL